MASLTPLSKGLIGLAVVGAMASAVWNLVLKERFAAPVQPVPVSTAGAPSETATMPSPPALDPPQPPATNGPSLSAAEHSEKGRKLLDGGDVVQARAHLEQAVKDGDGAAACLLGEMTLKGQGGISANQDKAAVLFQLAQSRNVICFASGK
jgi:hypothetical protein